MQYWQKKCANKISRQFLYEVQITNKHDKISTSLAITEMQMKTALILNLTLVRVAVMKKNIKIDASECMNKGIILKYLVSM